MLLAVAVLVVVPGPDELSPLWCHDPSPPVVVFLVVPAVAMAEQNRPVSGLVGVVGVHNRSVITG